MKRAAIFLFVLAFGIIFSLNFAMASNCPPVGPPKIYNGNVYVNGNLLTGTYTLNAIIGSDRVGQTTILNGKYSNLQISPCSGVSGQIIFAIHGIETNEKGTYSSTPQDEWGKKINLSLTLNQQPPTTNTCGDSAIQIGEECDGLNLAGRNSCGTGYQGTISCSSTCVIDYSKCSLIQQNTNPPAIDNQNNGGNNNNGGGGSGPSKKKNTDNSTINLGTGNSNSDLTSLGNEDSSENTENQDSSKRTVAGITGAVVNFTKTTAGKGTIAVILIAIIIGFMLGTRKPKSSNGKGKSKEIKVVKLSEFNKGNPK